MAKKKLTLEEKLEEAIVKDAPYEVPGNWVSASFGSIMSIEGGTQPPKSQFLFEPTDGYIRLYQIRDFSSENFHTYVKDNKKLRIMSEEDIMIARYGASIGKIFRGKKGAYNVALAKLIYPKELYNGNFLYWFLKSDLFQNNLGDMSRTAVAGFNKNDLKNFIIPLPPLKEQQRIVDKIESLFEKLDKAKELIEEARDDFENRKKIILRDAFVGKLTRNYRSRNNFKSNAYDLIKDIRNELEQWYKEECITAKLVGNKKPRKLNFDIQKSEFEYLFKEIPLTWRVSYFQEIIEPVDNALKAGPFGSSLKKSMYVEKGYKIYGQEQVISGNISYGDYYINEEKFNELKSCEVREGDLLISLVGTIGKTLIMPKEYEKGIINPRLLKISVNKKISAEYIKMYFESPIAKYIMSEKSHGGTMEILNLDIIKKLPIPIPPIEEQIEIVRILDKIFEEESKIEELTQLEEQIELIKKSILAKAFRGQLGTNCEDDESAIELLREILNK